MRAAWGQRGGSVVSLTWPVRKLQLMMAPRRRSVQKMCVGPRAMPQGSARPVATSHTLLPSRLAHCTLPALASDQKMRLLRASSASPIGSTSPRTTSRTLPSLSSQHETRPQLDQNTRPTPVAGPRSLARRMPDGTLAERQPGRRCGASPHGPEALHAFVSPSDIVCTF